MRVGSFNKSDHYSTCCDNCSTVRISYYAHRAAVCSFYVEKQFSVKRMYNYTFTVIPEEVAGR